MVLGWLTFSKQQTASMSHPIIHLTLLHWNSVDDRHLSLSKLLDYLTVWKRLVNTKSSCVISWTKLTDRLHLTHQYAHYLTSQVGLLVIRLIIVCIVQIVTSLHDENNRFSLARQTGTFCFFLCSFCFFSSRSVFKQTLALKVRLPHISLFLSVSLSLALSWLW